MQLYRPAAAFRAEGRLCAQALCASPYQQRTVAVHAVPRGVRSGPSQSLSSRQQEQQDRWWQGEDGREAGAGRRRGRAARADDWEEDLGKGLTGPVPEGFDVPEAYRAKASGKGGHAVRLKEAAARAQGRGRRPPGMQRSGEGRPHQQHHQRRRQQKQDEDAGPHVSWVNQVWHSSQYKPARGRRAMNEETDVDSDTDELLEADRGRAHRGATGRGSSSAAFGSRDSGSGRGDSVGGQQRVQPASEASAQGRWSVSEDVEEELERGGMLGRGDGGGRVEGDLSRSALRGEALYGVHPILNALLQRRREPYRLYVLAGMDLSKRKDVRAVRQVLSLAPKLGVGISRVSRHELNTLSGDAVHQGLVLDCSPVSFTPMDKLPPAPEVMQAAAAAGSAPPVWVALDEVLDPQNFGAMLRSCWCLGAAGMLVSAKNCAPLSPAVSKASAGAMEAAQVHAARMLRDTLMDAASSGWLVLGAAGDAGAQSVQDVHVDRPTIIVLGNEGRGLRTNIRRACTGLVRVDMGPQGQGFTGLGASGQGAAPSFPAATSSGAASLPGNDVPGRGHAGSRGSTSYWGGEEEGAEGPSDFEDGQDEAAAAAVAGSSGPASSGRHQSSTRGGSFTGTAGVDSLNVSVATGILLHSLTASAARIAQEQPSVSS